MYDLEISKLALVSGGQLTCKEALELSETDWDFDMVSPSEYCTKAQFSTYMLGVVDVLYNTPGFFSAAYQEQEDMMLGMIRGLNI